MLIEVKVKMRILLKRIVKRKISVWWRNARYGCNGWAKYEAEYNETVIDLIANRHAAKANGGFYVPPEPKVALVIRIRGITDVWPKAKKVIQIFRLCQIHNAIFVKLNEATIRMLRLMEPYVTYGYPTKAAIEKLI